MNFFEHQALARRKTLWMALMFCLSLALTMTAIHMSLWFLLKFFAFAPPKTIWFIDAVFIIATIVFTVSKFIDMRDPASSFSREMGAVELSYRSNEFYDRRLRNIVEEMAIASNIPCPKVFVIPNDMSINAFAAGYSISSGAIFVTEGSQIYLNREELQGVIAHEFSHIINGDMKSNVLMVSILEGLEGMYNFAWESLFKNNHDDNDDSEVASNLFGALLHSRSSGYIVLCAFVVMVIGYVGMFFSRLIKAGISRQREYLADASSVQFTRQTNGLSSALKKIAIMEEEGISDTRFISPEVSHMMFSTIINQNSWFSMDTHPPLRKRIQRLEPSYNDNTLERFNRKLNTLSKSTPSRNLRFNGYNEDVVLGFASGSTTTNVKKFSPPQNKTVNQKSTPENLTFKLGEPTEESLDLASYVQTLIPNQWSDPISSDKTVLLIYALMLDENLNTAQIQQSFFREELTDDDRKNLFFMYKEVKNLPHFVKNAMLWIHLPQLKHLTPNEIQSFSTNIKKISDKDSYVNLFENSLHLTIKSYLRDISLPTKKISGNWSIKDASVQIEKMLWFMASQNGDKKAYAFYAGWKKVFGYPQLKTPEFVVFPAAVYQIIMELTNLAPQEKEKLVSGLEEIIKFDGRFEAPEVAFFRACCFALGCPLPVLHIDVSPSFRVD